MSGAGMRAWDDYDGYLFDIDGTLLRCTDAVHYFAFCNALRGVAGRALNLDGVVAHGNTDVGILRDAFALAGIAEEAWRPRLASLRDAMCREVERECEQFRIEVLPRVPELLAHLRRRGALLSVATGNLQGIGTAKLQRCGLLQWFDCGTYSDAFEFRRDVLAAGVRTVRERTTAEAAICAVGDTPADIEAAQANGIDVIAVATGVYPFEELLALRPTRCVRSFDELFAGEDVTGS